MASFEWYNAAARTYGLTERQVQTYVNRHGLTKRRIYGCVAVESDEFNDLMERLGVPVAPNVISMVRHGQITHPNKPAGGPMPCEGCE